MYFILWSDVESSSSALSADVGGNVSPQIAELVNFYNVVALDCP